MQGCINSEAAPVRAAFFMPGRCDRSFITGKPLAQRLFQLADTYWLGKVVVHTGGEAAFTIDRDSETAPNADGEKGPQSGFQNIRDGMMVIHPVLAVSARLDSRLLPRLLLDGERVDNARIGSRLVDETSNTTVYTWVGIELEQTGEHTLEVQGIDGFGVTRFREQAAIRRTGELKAIRTGERLQNVADGLTPVQVQLDRSAGCRRRRNGSPPGGRHERCRLLLVMPGTGQSGWQ